MSAVDPEDNNPFVRRLPARIGKAAQFQLLRRLPYHSDDERTLSHVDRRYRVLRLLDYMDPLNEQLDLVERFDMAMRQGYRGRNPDTLSFRKSLLQSADDMEAGRDPLSNPEFNEIRGDGFIATYANGEPRAPRMPGFSILGCPGMGKSATIERILHSYPLTIRHTDTRDMIVQVPALKIECPSTGSRKSFCIEFFRLLDERLEQDGRLVQRYGSARRTVDAMLADVQHLVRLHAIGVLVVDEIQNLNSSKEGIEPLINFLVTMANKIGVGIVTIGTMAAKEIPQAAFHSARRASGLGASIWEPLRPSHEWDTFVKSMWKFQWTSCATSFDPDIDATLFHHSQGVVDILIKLFILAQLRVISNSELTGTPEMITCEVIEAVAKEDMAMVLPMIDALRTGNIGMLDRFEDLKPFHDYFHSVVRSAVGSDITEIQSRLAAEEAAVRARAGDGGTEKERFYVEMLKLQGVPDQHVHRVLAEILARVGPDDVSAIARAIGEAALAVEKPVVPKTKVRPVAERVKMPNDLRDIFSGLPEGKTMHEALVAAGIACSPRDAIAA